MENNNTIPKCPPLRFPEFTDEWKQTTLGEVAEFKKGSQISKEQLSDHGNPVILYGELYTTYKNEIISSVCSRTELEKETLEISQGGEVLIPSSGETAWEIAIARCIIQPGIILGGDLNILIVHENDGSFLSYLLSGNKKEEIAKIAQGSSVIHLYGKDLSKLSISLPSLPEQQKIATFLSLLDERIEAQRQIIKERKAEKKALLHQLFSQSIRFPGFTDEWKSFSVKEIGTLGRGRVISNAEIQAQECPIYPVYSSQTSNKGIMGYLDSFDFEGEYITWTTDGANAGTVFFRNGRFNCTNVCGTLKLEPSFDHSFCTLGLQKETKKFVSTNLANPKLMNHTMANIFISLPSLPEQQKIAELFTILDERIEVEETLLASYETQKHYLLQQMFV